MRHDKTVEGIGEHGMQLNHTTVPARDKHTAAQFFADVFGTCVGRENPGTTPAVLRWFRSPVSISRSTMCRTSGPSTMLFMPATTKFDSVLARLRERGVSIAADPFHKRPGELNANEGGRGFYFLTPDGHNIELLTRVKSNAGGGKAQPPRYHTAMRAMRDCRPASIASCICRVRSFFRMVALPLGGS